MIENLIKAATCRISCGAVSGTGWLIAKDRVITARHCVLESIQEGKPVEMVFPALDDVAVSGTIIAHSEEWDVCLLALEIAPAAEPLPATLEVPREGDIWQTFGYPGSKSDVGHRLSGTVAQILNVPRRKIDIDLSIDPTTALQLYKGLSGGAVVCEGSAVGVILVKFDGTVAAVSLHRLENFFTENGAALVAETEAPSAPLLAERGDFLETFTQAIRSRAGSYMFLQGAHGYGKSTFCKEFRENERETVNLGAYCLSDSESALGADYWAQPQVFLDWLATKIAALITGKRPRKGERGYAEQIRQTGQYLDAFSNYCIKSERQGMFFIDGLNEVPGDALLSQLLGMLPATLPSKITIIFTAPNFSNVARLLAGKVNTNDVFELPPLSDSACYRHCFRALKRERRSPALANRICEKAKGHPLYLRYLIEYANVQETDDDLDEFPVLTGPIEEYYQRIWAKLLPDGDAVNLLALMARLRWGISIADFAKTLNPAEQVQFVPVIGRIRHLLADDETTTIYHASFAAFIIAQTATVDALAYRRLAQFCVDEPGIRYCTLNRVFHLWRSDDNRAFSECNQTWFDTTVTLGVEPDALIADVDAVVKRAAEQGSAEEFFRITLLAQRISFRYDTLFAQSARLIAEALIVLGRPSEALQHVLRLNTLIVGPDEALQISFALHQHGFDDEALILLDRLQQRIIERYESPIKFGYFLKLCSWHLQTHFQIRLAIDGSGMEQYARILDLAGKACGEIFGDDPVKIARYMQPLVAESPTYFLSFRDEYADISRIKAEYGDNVNVAALLPSLCIALLKFEETVEDYHLSKGRKALAKLFADLEQLVPAADIEEPLANIATDTLIRFGAAARVVGLFGAKRAKQAARPLRIRAKNGVDVDHEDLQECLRDWRVAAFLDSDFRAPASQVIAGIGWLESIEQLIGALYCCDGKARRAKADSHEEKRIACLERLKVHVIEPLRFSLLERVAWKDSYAIPENALPQVYRQLAELLSDCFPEELADWLDDLVARANGQWGMYSEGFRAAAYHVLRQLTRREADAELAPRLLGLLHALRDHVLRGVENRHELVPEILRIIPVFTYLGAKEEAERLYQQLLSVSMGPSWYKEDQLGVMTEVLKSISVGREVGQRLPQVAGYLEKASGEMTFQRFVRSEKSSLLGQIARRGKYRSALAYFRRQCCGSTSELWTEAQQGQIDKVGPLKGNRFPGGALDDQSAILELVRNSEAIPWAIRWAMLEIFHCGDRRYLDEYAEAFAKIANEVGCVPELVKRAEIVANAETPSNNRSSFASAFQKVLRTELHNGFAAVFAGLPPFQKPETKVPRNHGEIGDDEEGGFFHPGVLGRQKALRDADKILEEVERQWSLGNRNAAKAQAVKVLEAAQEGGWNIWGNLSDGARRAEELLVQGESSAANVIHYYAPLIEAERYAPKWIPAEHLIRRVGSLLTEAESLNLLDAVIDHVRLVVGDATREIQEFGALSYDASEFDSTVEFLRLIIWLCDHPQWLRRERAAAMVLWLIDQCDELFAEAVKTAFSMDEGYGPDVLCGVLDGASIRQPAVVWDKIAGVLDLTRVTHDLRHVSRMTVLERLASRAEKVGSASAKSATGLISASFTGKRKTGGNPSLPIWAGRLAREWRRFVKLVNAEFVAAWKRELEQLCSPLTITDALTLETAVATSFREPPNRPFDRWESKLRYALNLALWSRVSRDDAGLIEALLRIYNPSQPERTLRAISNAFTDRLMEAIESSDYSTVLGSNETVLLNYHDMFVNDAEDGMSHFEVLCLLQPSASQWSSFAPRLEHFFQSSELPPASTVKAPFETCCRLKPEVVFFDPFTPAIPLPFFQNLVGAKDQDFVRQNWRCGRRNELRGFGQPERHGCLLSISRKALNIPAGFKLAWVVSLDGEIITVVDERNNRLI